MAGEVRRGPAGVARRGPLEKAVAPDQPPEGPAHRVDRDTRFEGEKREEEDRLREGARKRPGRVLNVEEEALVLRLLEEPVEEADDRRGEDECRDGRRPRDRARQEEPRDQEQGQLGRRHQAAAEVVHDLPAREDRERVPPPPAPRNRDRRQGPGRDLPVAPDPAVVARDIGEVPRRMVLVEHDVGHKGHAGVRALDQVVGEDAVLGEPIPEGRPEGLEVVEPLPDERGLLEEVLVDVETARVYGSMPGSPPKTRTYQDRAESVRVRPIRG